MNLENAVGSRKSVQPIDSSVCRITSYMKKVLITNKVTSGNAARFFFITLSKSIVCTSFSRPTAFSRLKVIFLVFCLLGWLAPVQASIEAYQFESAEMEADYNQLINELRCLVCQNQNLAGSDADLARDLRRETYEMVNEGKSQQQVIDFMVERYGDFVLYRPQFKSTTYLLWLGPFLLLLCVLVFLVRRLLSAAKPEVDADAVARAKQILDSKEEPNR